MHTQAAATIHPKDISPGVRAAFLRAFRHAEHPPAFAARRGSGGILTSVVGLAALAFLLLMNYGEPAHASEPLAFLAFYATAVAVVAGGIANHVRYQRFHAQMGFRPGTYVIGGHLVDARPGAIRIVPFHDETPYRITVHGWGVAVFSGGLRFPFADPEAAECAIDVFRTDCERIQRALADGDHALLATIDPAWHVLDEADRRPSRRSPPRPWAAAAVVAAATLVIAPTVFVLRNQASIDAAFAEIYTIADADAWMASGGDAARGTERRMVLVFDDTLARGNASELRALRVEYPGAPAALRARAEAALVRRYQQARSEALAGVTGADLRAFILAFYARLEAGGEPYLVVTVRDIDTKDLVVLDTILARETEVKVADVGRHFTDLGDRGLAGIDREVREVLRRYFPEDVVTFTEGMPGAPRVELAFRVSPLFDKDGLVTYAHHRNGKPVPGAPIYPGVTFDLAVTLSGDATSERRFSFSAVPAPEFRADVYGSDPGAAVYPAMAASAFADLRSRMIATLDERTTPAATAAR
jgi:hypothetical protein